MPAVLLLARISARGRLAALGGLALLVALGLGTATAALTASWRTEHAYETYLRDAEVSELVVNPSVITDRIASAIPATPGVVDVTTDTLLAATVDTGAPRTPRDLRHPVQVRYSPDGRYVSMDRPVVHEGRMIRGGAEAFVNLELAEAMDLRLGDTLPLAFWPISDADSHSTRPTEVIAPIGRAEVRVVGIGVFANEVLADELFPRGQVLVTPEVAGPYDCTPKQPAVDDERTFDQLRGEFWPSDCAAMYRYYSLRLSAGNAGVARVGQLLEALASKENARLPAAVKGTDAEEFYPNFYVVPAVAAEEKVRVARSLAPSVTALRLLGIAAGCATLALAVLTLLRMVRRKQPAPSVWQQLGATRSQRAVALGAPLLAAVAVGVAGAVLVAWLGAAVGPVASARLLAPRPAFVLVPMVVGPLVLGFLLLLGGAVAAAAYVAAEATSTPGVVREGAAAAAAARTGDVPFALGVRAALGGTAAIALLGAAVAAVGVVVGSVVFGTNLTNVVTTPARFGWSYDAAMLVGSGYGGANEPVIAETLDRPEVAAWSVVGLGSAIVDGESVPFVGERSGSGRVPLEVVEGRRPSGPDELALGAGTAARLGISIGDTVAMNVGELRRTGTVTGLVVLPPVGPIYSDRAGLGTGMWLPASFIEEMHVEAAQAAGVTPDQLLAGVGSFVAVDLRPGVDASRFLAQLGDLRAWDLYDYGPVVLHEPVRPAQIADVAALRSAPVLLASLVALAMAVALTLAVGLAVRTRRLELALLRALGATGPQLRATLRWQSLVIIGTGLVAGVPLGIALGRLTWQGFARDLGIPPLPAVSVQWTLAIVLAALAIGLAASVVPGLFAARVSPSAILRRD
ncbi:FtsX-like permease family protein [Tenggerimyces flavus]|uniref:FtsX-like permease family protein n=1 Tax=Tenggerimyces flavus TaxID=1708749 RepID=A0ABV7Y625_9ACTN|nr:FtsX-like permease family protein [Tenggerimyces flavus]MBM7785159.1 hypothetical protein [Tenggerimyces flavus]